MGHPPPAGNPMSRSCPACCLTKGSQAPEMSLLVAIPCFCRPNKQTENKTEVERRYANLINVGQKPRVMPQIRVLSTELHGPDLFFRETSHFKEKEAEAQTRGMLGADTLGQGSQVWVFQGTVLSFIGH